MTPPHRAPTYRAVLRVTGVPRFLVPALLGRLSYGMVSLALVLSVFRTTGSYTDVGLVVGLFGLTATVLSPSRAALVDRYGPLRALTPMAGLHGLALVGLAAASWHPGGHLGLLAALTSVAGASAPPLGPVTRTVWSRLVRDRDLLQRAYSLDTVAEELIFLTGPLILGALMRVGPPAAGLTLGALLVVVGTVGLVTSPAARRPRAVGRAPAARSVAEVRTAPGRSEPEPPRLTARGGFLSAVATSAATGLTLGSVGLLNVAFAERTGAVEAVVLVEAAQAAGSALGGLAYGALTWRTGPRVRLALLGLALGGGVAAAALVPGVSALAALLFVVGACTAPIITTAYLLADASVPDGYRTRAGNWVNTAHNAGASVGAAAVGPFLTTVPAEAGYSLAGAVLVVVSGAVLAAGATGRARFSEPAEVTGPSATSARRRR
ncbi:MFS transporter [Nocardiopsis sp. NPDC058789]|uniref:MFS transporter n=1 Tax=Nocardiopsis sp. NPDC058789 TaxID=3346634 RepID=UPI00366E7E8B